MREAVNRAALDAMAATQLSGRLPGWFLPNVITSLSESGESCRLCYSIFRSWELNENEAWELQEDGSRVLVWEDSVKGKMITMLYGRPEEERIELFAVAVDLATTNVVVEGKTELSELDLEGIHLHTTVEMVWPEGAGDEGRA